jgi:hypothetical protein
VTVSVIVGVAVVVVAVDECVVRVVPVESVVVEPDPDPHAARTTHVSAAPIGATKTVVTRRSDRTGAGLERLAPRRGYCRPSRASRTRATASGNTVAITERNCSAC